MKIKNRGWIVTWCAVGINLAAGLLYSWSVFAAALVKDFGFTKTQASLPYTIALAMLALLSIFGGKLQDRYGPRICATMCGILCGLGLIISGYADSIFKLALAFGLLTGSGVGLANGATIPAAVKWFPPQKRGLISGLVVGGVGLASVYVAPLTQYLVNNFGLKNAFIIEGVLFSTVILFLSQFLSNPPASYVVAGMHAPSDGPISVSAKRDYSPSEMVATFQFRLIWVMYLCGTVAGLMIIGHMAIIAEVQANIGWAYVLVAILAVFNASGRVVGGLMSDKLGRTRTLFVVFILQAVNMMLFSNYTNFTLLTLGIAVAGICYGSLLAIFPAITFDYYGMKHSGVNYGIVFSAWGVAGVIGPMMAGYIVDITKTYQTAYWVAAGLLFISAFLVLMLKPPQAIADSRKVTL